LLASPRNCIDIPSVNLMFLKSDASQRQNPGPPVASLSQELASGISTKNEELPSGSSFFGFGST
jgi:hypothetical protein